MFRHIEKKHFSALCILVVFAVLLALNIMTHYVADDWVYMLSFSTKEPIKHIGDIFPSMYVHSSHMNGRVISHGLVQLFFIFPKIVFDICNSLAACLLLYFGYRICCKPKKSNPILLLLLAAGFWCMLPAFGQVVLWQTGAVNYLWGLLFGVLYLIPYIKFFLYGDGGINKLPWKILFALFSAFVGAYTEITSFIVIFTAVVLLFSNFRSARKTWLWWPVACGIIGYIFLLCMPAELGAKQGNLSFAVLFHNLLKMTYVLLQKMWPLIALWILLMIFGLVKRKLSRYMWLSTVLFVGAIAANYMMIAATYYAERCMCTTAVFLLLANAIMINDLLLTEEKKKGNMIVVGVLSAVVFLCFIYSAYVGCADIYRTHCEFSEREEFIYSELDAGNRDLHLPIIRGNSKYSIYEELLDVDSGTWDTWPNTQMAKYYGADTVIGEPKK